MDDVLMFNNHNKLLLLFLIFEYIRTIFFNKLFIIQTAQQISKQTYIYIIMKIRIHIFNGTYIFRQYTLWKI